VTSFPSDLRAFARKPERDGLLGTDIPTSFPTGADPDCLARAFNRSCRDLLLSSAVAR
jgi:hypothetical protein